MTEACIVRLINHDGVIQPSQEGLFVTHAAFEDDGRICVLMRLALIRDIRIYSNDLDPDAIQPLREGDLRAKRSVDQKGSDQVQLHRSTL